MSTGKYRKEKDCLNCGHLVEENFCTHCGQENLQLKEDALHLVSHAIADYFHFESKLFGTLKPLLFKPGMLTQQYVAGKRVSFIHPIRLYIFISIVFFLVILSSSHNEPKVEVKDSKSKKEAFSPRKDSLDRINEQQIRSSLKNIPMPAATRDSIIKEAVKGMKNDKEPKDTNKLNPLKSKNIWFNSLDTTEAAYEKRQLSLPKAKRDNIFQNYLAKKSIRLQKYPDAGDRLTKEFLHNVPKLMFILLPLFALILKLVYWRKKKYYYEHLIYSFHVHSALFLTVLFTMLLQWIFGFIYDISSWLTFCCLIYMLWYIYRSLRTFYGSRRWVTVVKMWFLFISYTIVFTLSALLIIIFSAIMV
jgi:hypothetical protein